MRKRRQRLLRSGRAGLLTLAVGIAGNGYAQDADAPKDEAAGQAEIKGKGDNYINVGGYQRGWAAMNLQDHPETGGGRGELSMLRGSLQLNVDAGTGPLRWTAVGRADREALTPYQRQLQDINRNGTSGGPGSSLLDQYNRADLREFYVDFDLGEYSHFRIGKQQVVWGETDFFHLTDVLQGFDYRWRSFLERDNDELRKPLLMLNGKFDVPALDGMLQAVIRPGVDRKRDIGNTYDLYGGRWAMQPYKGVDFLAPGMLTTNYDHPAGNANDVTGGVRWTGMAGSLNYSLSYLHTFKPDPVVNSAFAPWGSAPRGQLGDFIYPRMNVFGASVSGDIPGINTVVAAEVAYQKGVAYNVGTNFFGGQLPGFGGIVKKDVIVSSLRLDKQFRLMELLGTSENTFASLQIFDTWIRNYRRGDDMVYVVGFGKQAKEHTTVLTGLITLNYMSSRLNPGLAVGVDLSNGDAFVIPSIEYKLGNHWRFVAEADLFFPKHQRQPGQVEMSTGPLGGFAHNSQFMVRATYQF